MMAGNYFLGFFILFLFSFSCGLALDDNAKGVCSVKVSSPRTRTKYVTVLSKKLCGKKRCVIKQAKKEKYMVTTDQIVCCTGYQYDSETDACIPQCSTGCLGGTCIEPEVCQCDPPSVLQDNTCKLQCQCFNGSCVNNTCTCTDGHVKLNSTHCAVKCSPGSTLDDDLYCVPLCKVNCTNGVCIGDNVCSCNEGFTYQNGACVPICSQKCEEYGNCETFDDGTVKCICNEGFNLVNDNECVPECDCENSNCTLCECGEGYYEENGICQPICEKPCVNSTCTAADECTCLEGYTKDEVNNEICRPICSGQDCEFNDCRKPKYRNVQKTRNKTKIVTINKRCGWRRCTAKKTYIEHYIDRVPTATCCDGWEYVSDTDSCRPQCQSGCTNGTCVAPNVCNCTPPFIKNEYEQCEEPICDPPCVNAQCTANNTCTCNADKVYYNSTHCIPQCYEGYENDPTNFECIPKCDQPCINGTCTDPNICTCFDGYNKRDDKCEPLCTPNCENADCIAPDTCLCKEGFINQEIWKCVPYCDQCENGDCVAPNTCTCHEGYTKKDGLCLAKCDQDCLHGFCSSPNVCTCNPGYEYDKELKTCKPECTHSCINATCVAPNTCSCLEGYEKTDTVGVCKPKCDACINGDCIAPNICLCHNGYIKLEDQCKPQCDQNCTNGYCSEPNICTCHLGYSFDEQDNFTCRPTCNPKCINSTCELPNQCSCLKGYEASDENWKCKPKCDSCFNGTCIDPGLCQCQEGYKLISNYCLPICDGGCENGFCSGPNHCQCKEGYVNSEINRKICYKPCKNCSMGTCSVHGECTCYPGFVLEDDTCITPLPVECDACNGTCDNITCLCADGKLCFELLKAAETITTPKLAGLEISWIIGGTLSLLMVAVIIAIISKTWAHRQKKLKKPPIDANTYGSVIYARPDTLLQRSELDKENLNRFLEGNNTEEDETSDPLLNVGEVIELRSA